MAFFGFDQSLSFPTAGQGNDDSGNETPCDKVNLFHCDSNDFSMTSAELKKKKHAHVGIKTSKH